MTDLTKHSDLIVLLDQQPELMKLFLRVLWKTLALPPEDDLWKELAEGFAGMCEKTHHKRLINLIETHKDFFEPALTALYRQLPPDRMDAVMLTSALRRGNKGAKDFHHDLQDLTDQMRDLLQK